MEVRLVLMRRIWKGVKKGRKIPSKSSLELLLEGGKCQQAEVGERHLCDKGAEIKDSRMCLGIDTLISLNTKNFITHLD